MTGEWGMILNQRTGEDHGNAEPEDESGCQPVRRCEFDVFQGLMTCRALGAVRGSILPRLPFVFLAPIPVLN